MLENSSSVGVVTTDAQLIIQSWDSWLAEASGIPESDVVGRPLLDAFPEIAQRGLEDRLHSVLRDGVVEVLAPTFHNYLIRIPTSKGGSFFDVMQQHVTMSPLRHHSEISGVIITIEDVTARFAGERQLVEQLKSHDEAVRLRAAKRLSDRSDPAPLLGAMADASWQVRRLAASTVAEGSEQVVDHLVRTIREHHDDLALLNSTITALAQTRHNVLPALVPLLEDPEPSIRMYTALAIGLLRNPRGVVPLLKLLSDPDINVQYHAIEALGRLRGRDANEALFKIVRSRDPYLSFAALDAIAGIGAPSSFVDILPLLEDDLLVEAAADALAVLGNELAVTPLLRALKSGAPAPRICCALSSIHHRLQGAYGEDLVAHLVRREVTLEDVELLVAGVARATDEELSAIAEVLGWLEQPGLEAVLGGLLIHPAARLAARDALVARGSHAIGALSEMLGHDDPEVRKVAALGLGQIGEKSAVPALANALTDQASEVAIAAALALASVGSNTAFEPLVQLLGHANAAVRSAAVSAINSIGHPETEAAVSELVRSPDTHVRECAVKIAGYFGYPTSFESVLSFALDPEEPVQRTAVEHLGYFGDPRAVAALGTALTSTNAAVRASAARALAHVDPDEAIPLLEAALNDSDSRVQYHAVRSIVTQDLESFVPALRRRLESDNAVPVRIAAAEALHHFRDKQAAQLLSSHVDDADSDMACAAISALGAMPGSHAENAFIMALSSGDPRRQIAALRGVEESGLESVVPYVQRAMRQTRDRDVRSAALNVLTANGGPAGIEAVLELAGDPEWDTASINALSRLPEHLLTHLARGLKHSNPHVRWVVVESLARMKKTAASKILAGALTDRDPGVRFAISQALGRLDLL